MTYPGYEDDDFWIAVTNIPDDFKRGLADCIINFGRLEVAIDQLIWWAIGVKDKPAVGKALTARLDIRPKCEMALAVLAELEEERFRLEFKMINKRIETATRRRNSVVHGWWMSVGSDRAVAMSTRAKVNEPGAFVAGVPFTVEDLHRDAAIIKEAERAILKMTDASAPPTRKPAH